MEDLKSFEDRRAADFKARASAAYEAANVAAAERQRRNGCNVMQQPNAYLPPIGGVALRFMTRPC